MRQFPHNDIVLWNMLLGTLGTISHTQVHGILVMTDMMYLGTVSSAVLTHRNITKLYNMLECLLTVLRTLCEGCCMAVHNLGEQASALHVNVCIVKTQYIHCSLFKTITVTVHIICYQHRFCIMYISVNEDELQ